MRALRVHDLMGPPGLWVDQTPIPPRPDQTAVRIAVDAAGIGFVDTLVARGKYQVRQEPPYIPGMEVAGVVESAPPGSGFAVGQRVYASVPDGGCAEIVWAQERLVAPLPDSVSAAQGAALVVNDHTAHVALVRRAGVRPGESVLVHGAAGGLGSAAVRIAVALGARVTAVASTPQRRAAATAAGAHQVYGPDEWLDQIRADGGADIIVDPIGGDVFDASLRALAREGRLLTLGYVSGRIPSAPANRLLLRNCDVRGVNWGGLIATYPELFRSTGDDLAILLADGMPPPTTVEHDLADAQAAFTAIEQRDIIGKTVLLVRQPGAMAR
ncbi:NADPH:quinone oxidoreductase family protein [Nakamurella sp. GG22]